MQQQLMNFFEPFSLVHLNRIESSGTKRLPITSWVECYFEFDPAQLQTHNIHFNNSNYWLCKKIYPDGKQEFGIQLVKHLGFSVQSRATMSSQTITHVLSDFPAEKIYQQLGISNGVKKLQLRLIASYSVSRLSFELSEEGVLHFDAVQSIPDNQNSFAISTFTTGDLLNGASIAQILLANSDLKYYYSTKSANFPLFKFQCDGDNFCKLKIQPYTFKWFVDPVKPLSESIQHCLDVDLSTYKKTGEAILQALLAWTGLDFYWNINSDSDDIDDDDGHYEYEYDNGPIRFQNTDSKWFADVVENIYQGIDMQAIEGENLKFVDFDEC